MKSNFSDILSVDETNQKIKKINFELDNNSLIKNKIRKIDFNDFEIINNCNNEDKNIISYEINSQIKSKNNIENKKNIFIENDSFQNNISNVESFKKNDLFDKLNHLKIRTKKILNVYEDILKNKNGR